MSRKVKDAARPRSRSHRESAALANLLRYAGPILIGLAFVALTVWSWRKWPDPLVDFGRELYVPWRIAEGSVLYKDIASPYGPFSPYLNALFFKLFGVSLTTLILCNLLILAGFTVLVYRFFNSVCDRITATAVCLVLIGVFSFSQYVVIGNYNFITPYSHEAVHSTILAVLLIYLLHRFAVTRKAWLAGISGCCLGLILMTKPEVALAAVAAVLLWIALFYWHPANRSARTNQPILLFAGGALLLPAVFFLYFRWHLSTAEACRAVSGCWIPLLRGGLTINVFYIIGAGLDEPGANLLRILSSSLKIGFFLLLLWGIDTLAGYFKKVPRSLCALISIALFFLFFFKSELVEWEEIGRPFPLFMMVLTVAMLWMFFRRKGDWLAAAPFAALSAWAAFSLLLLAKMILNARLYHYGFYLAMPATLALIWALLWLIPKLLSSKSRRGTVFKWLAASAIAAGVIYHLQWSQRLYQPKTYVLAGGGDAIKSYGEDVLPTATVLNEALDAIGRLTTPNDTMVVLPEGAMVNYLSMRVSPTPYLNFLPPEMFFYGEATMLASIKANKPAVIIFVTRDTREFGVESFGSDSQYGRQILDWVNQEYIPFKLIGAEPFQEGRFGIKIMKRRS